MHEVYSIIVGLHSIKRLIPEPVVNRYPIRDIGHIPNIHTRLVSTGKSFFPSTIKQWNRLPVTTVSAPNFRVFKKIITHTNIGRVKYHTLCVGKEGKWLSRLRMGLSALCQHRFTYNLVDDASCPSCGQRETTSHFFFKCPAYAVPRNELYNSLAQLSFDINNKRQLLHTILYGSHSNQELLLEIVFKFLAETHRFV